MELKPHVSQTVLVVKREHIVSHMLENARYSKPISLYLVYPHVYPHVCWWNHIGLFGEVKSFWPITSEILLHHPASLLKLHTWKSWILKDSSLHLSTSPLICSRKVKIFMDLDGFWWILMGFCHVFPSFAVEKSECSWILMSICHVFATSFHRPKTPATKGRLGDFKEGQGLGETFWYRMMGV